LARLLVGAGAEVRGFDPMVSQWPADFDLPVTLTSCVAEAVEGADAAVITTEWPQFRDEDWQRLAATMASPVLLDPKGHLAARAAEFRGITYAVVGRLAPASEHAS
jgi:UDPglucose 6-dehydrogenase